MSTRHTVQVLESDEKPPELYRRLFIELELARRAAGGQLSPVEEARRVDELDRAWWCMTNAEQDDYERSIGRIIAKVWRKGKIVRLPPLPRTRGGRVGWLRGYVLLPRWLVVVVWLVHGGLSVWLGRLMP